MGWIRDDRGASNIYDLHFYVFLSTFLSTLVVSAVVADIFEAKLYADSGGQTVLLR